MKTKGQRQSKNIKDERDIRKSLGAGQMRRMYDPDDLADQTDTANRMTRTIPSRTTKKRLSAPFDGTSTVFKKTPQYHELKLNSGPLRSPKASRGDRMTARKPR